MTPIKVYAMPLHRLSDLIKAERKRKELTLDQLSTLTGLAVSHLQGIESGTIQNPTIDTLANIMKHLNIKIFSNKDYGGAKGHNAEIEENGE